MKTALSLITLLFLFSTVFAQSGSTTGLTDSEITELSSNLAMKLILSDTQTTSVENLLKNYRTDLTKVMGSSVQESQNKIMSATNEQIVKLLDSKQQMKFKVISADWWKSVQEAASN